MKKLILIISAAAFVHGGLLDFNTIKNAKNAYNSGDFNKSIELYSKIKDKNDQAKYDLANSYYKAGKYKEAANLYKEIKDKNLEFNKLHNLGNSLAKMKKIDEAIKAYEDALKIKEDKDTRYNLELLKKKKKEQQKKKNKNKKQDKKKDKKKDNKQQNKQNKDKNKQNKQNKQNQKNKDNKQQDKNSKGDKNKKQEQNKNNQNKNNQNKSQNQKKQDKKEKQKQEQNRASKEKKDKQKQKKDAQKKAGEKALKKQVPISDMELRKYNKMMDKRGIKTLLLPMQSKGAKKDEKQINPW